METHLADFIRGTPTGREAEAILRACVHCGFCTATCPTYQLFGDELDGPRGRIYLIKQVLEGAAPSAKTRLHLDRCLTCRACETTCPSGVRYARLLDIGRAVIESALPRRGGNALARRVLRELLPRPGLFGPLLKLARTVRPLLPAAVRAKVMPAGVVAARPAAAAGRRMLALAGCVQPALLPNVNAATARVLARFDIRLDEIAGAGCCGAVRYHLDDIGGAEDQARCNIDAWWPDIEAGAEAIVVTASACAVQIKDYGRLLADDKDYADKAARVSALARDVSEVMSALAEPLKARLAAAGPAPGAPMRVAFHAPCTLQHGLKLRGVVEPLLTMAGFELVPVADGHLCCGSAGTYSVLQAEIATTLRQARLAALSAGRPALIASANVGCIVHLQDGDGPAVCHWVELIDQRLTGMAPSDANRATMPGLPREPS